MDVSALGAPWALVGVDELQFPLAFRGELTWIDERRVAFTVADPFGTEEQVPAWAELGADARGFTPPRSLISIAGGQLGLLPAPGGFVLFNGTPDGVRYVAVDAPDDSVLADLGTNNPQRGPWLSPGQRLAGRTTADGRLQIFDLNGVLAAETAPGVCGRVVAWTTLDTDRHRLACSGLDASGAAITEDMALIDYATTSKRLTVSLIPELERAVLAKRRRAFSTSGKSFAFVTDSKLVMVDATQPQPVPSTRNLEIPASFDVQYGTDEQLLMQRGSILSLLELDGPLRTRTIADALESQVSLPANAVCQEDFFSAPRLWCGLARAPGFFGWSPDSQTILLEDDTNGLWISDVRSEAGTRQVTRDLAPCIGATGVAWTRPCSKPYAFQP